MTPKKDPKRLEEIISQVETKVDEPRKPPSVWARTAASLRNRIITGIVFVLPIVVTIWFVQFFLNTIYARIEPVLKPSLVGGWGMDPTGAAYKAVGILLSVIVVVAVLYLVGLITARRAVRRLIGLAEMIVVRIPFVKFFYTTTKRIVDSVTASSSSSVVKKVVVIEYPRRGVHAIGFVTGLTIMPGQSEPLVNLFVPTTPNPTSGYMVMLKANEVYETDLSIEEAMRFVISGGILPPDVLATRPLDLSVLDARDESKPEALATSLVE